MPLVMSPEALARSVDEQTTALMAAWPDLIERYRNGTTQEKLAALSLMSRALNTPYLMDRVNDGNCVFAALALVQSATSGNPLTPAPYGAGGRYKAVIAELDKGGYVPISEDASAVEAGALARMRDGDMALLGSEPPLGDGHATALVRLEGKLYVIENQGGATGQHRVSTLSEYVAREKSSDPSVPATRYTVVFPPTTLVRP